MDGYTDSGAYDMKGGLAACMSAMAAASRRGLSGDVIFTAVVDEEYASLGTQALAHEYHADGAIVAEFTELQLILAHKGFVWLEVETLGLVDRTPSGDEQRFGCAFECSGHEAVLGLDGHLLAGAVVAGLTGDQHRLVVHGSGGGVPCVKSVPRAVVSRFLWPPLVVTAVLLNSAPVSASVGPTLVLSVNTAATRAEISRSPA